MSNFKSMKRAVHFDFHTQDGIDNFGESFDAEKFAQQMADAHVTYVNVFARCNIGYSYYPTKVGVPYPGMKENRLGDIVRACHKMNIGVTGYLNAGLNHEMSARHPEWLQMNKNGQIYNFQNGGNFFRTVCHNTGYAEHFLAEIEEILEQGVDGIFCDCFGLRPCYCAKCLEDMLSEGIDIDDESAVTDFSNRARIKIMERTKKLVPKDKRLFFNGSLQWGGKEINTHFEVECLPAAWGFDSFLANAAYARTVYDEVIYMNGRFQISWGDFGGYKGKAAIENDFYDALTQAATPMLGDHLHPAECPTEDIYRELGEIYSKIESYEKWTDNAKFIPELAILTDGLDANSAVSAAARMLAELKYTFDVVNIEGDFTKYPLLILPDTLSVGDAFSKKLKAYLKNGGKIISTGFSGLLPDGSGFALPEWDFEYFGNSIDALKKTDRDEHRASFKYYFNLKFEAPTLAKMPYSAYNTAIRIKEAPGGESLATEVSSYFDKSGWNGRHFIFYTPPKAETEYSAMAVNAENNVAHIPFKLFSSYANAYAFVFKVMLKNLLERFLPENLIKASDMPSTSRITLTGTDAYKLLHVKVTYPEIRGRLGIVEEHTVLPAGHKISVKGEYTSVYRLPDMLAVQAKTENGYTEITLPQIYGYDMLLLEK